MKLGGVPDLIIAVVTPPETIFTVFSARPLSSESLGADIWCSIPEFIYIRFMTRLRIVPHPSVRCILSERPESLLYSNMASETPLGCSDLRRYNFTTIYLDLTQTNNSAYLILSLDG